MITRRGFTLIEMVVVLIIVGVLTALILPNFITVIEQTKAQGAKNNLLAIASAEEKFSEDHSGVYCINSGATPNCGTTSPSLISDLGLTFSSTDPFTYSCSIPNPTPPPYTCTATDPTLQLTLTVTVTNGSAMGATVSCCTFSGVTCNAGGSACPS